MNKEVFEKWSTSTRDLYILLNLRIRQAVHQRQLLPCELMQFALFIENNVNEAADDERVEAPFAELERAIAAGLDIFQNDIALLRAEELKNNKW